MSSALPNCALPVTGRRVGFALVGCGRISANHIEALRQHQAGAQLVVVCDNQPAAPATTVALTGARGHASLAPASQDVVLQSTVFSGLLDDHFQQRLAERMWVWLKPGGAVRWCDVTVNNPRNRDRRGVPLCRCAVCVNSFHRTASAQAG